MGVLLSLDRRFVFLLLALTVVITAKCGDKIDIPVTGTGTVKDVFMRVEALKSPREGRDRPILLMSFDFDPSSSPELGPISLAALRHAMRKGHRIVGLTLWPSGVALANGYMQQAAREMDEVTLAYRLVPKGADAIKERDATLAAAKSDAGTRRQERLDAAAKGPDAGRAQRMAEAAAGELGAGAMFVPALPEVTAVSAGATLPWSAALHHAVAKAKTGEVVTAEAADGLYVIEVLHRRERLEYGTDYCFLGTKPGLEIVILGMGQSVYDTFPTDSAGKPIRDLPLMREMATLRDADYLLCLAAGDSADKWIVYGQQKSGLKMSVGCTAVMAPDLYPYRQARQIDGIVGGIRGAWEYEALTGIPDKARTAVPAQSAAHLLLVALIALGNLGYFLSRRKARAQA